MKGLAWLLGLGCLVAIAMGLYGVWNISQSGMDAAGVDAMMSIGSIFGAQSYLSDADRLTYFAMQNRANLILFGGIGFVLALILGKVAEKS